MFKVKLFVADKDPDASTLVSRINQSGVDYSVVPTSGPMSIWVEGSAYIGPTAVGAAVSRLIENRTLLQRPNEPQLR